ncbi:MAG: ribosome silencing factor [Gammaproteobacteria bacterium]|nr:ribosome silencing factor [Gammaproteobacteria bacterium]
MTVEDLVKLAHTALEDLKARAIVEIDVRGKTTVSDVMLIATGTSSRHIKSLADHVIEKAKQEEHMPLGIEGHGRSDWVLVDLGDVIVHIMTEESRDFYALEKLWQMEDGEVS